MVPRVSHFSQTRTCSEMESSYFVAIVLTPDKLLSFAVILASIKFSRKAKVLIVERQG